MRRGFQAVRLVGQSSDGGADLLAHSHGKRWLIQAKRWSGRVGGHVLDKTVAALGIYQADIPVVICLAGFEPRAWDQQKRLLSSGVMLQLWDRNKLLAFGRELLAGPEPMKARDYQEEAIASVMQAYHAEYKKAALVVLATGLGKTFVAADIYRRLATTKQPFRALVIAHTNDLVYQLERAFWPFLADSAQTVVWNGQERPSDQHLKSADLIFGCLPTVFGASEDGRDLGALDLVIIDECHHVGSAMYESIISSTRAGGEGGPFLLGMTATPWRADRVNLEHYFGAPLISIDLVTGLRMGFLTNVDYRIFTDNIDWSGLLSLPHTQLSPRQINRRLFINQWDDAVIDALQSAWREQNNPRAIVFCGTVDHAITMTNRINARRFCAAEAIFSGSQGANKLSGIERHRILADFHDRRIDVICAIDIFNEGIDVPDVNILVFQRVTHSRRIFVQQLGRGLRLAEGKDKVIVLDFVSDIRRFAAGLELKQQLESNGGPLQARVDLPSGVTFRRVGGADPKSESFLREWLEDVAAIEDAGDDASVLRYPPRLEAG